MPPVSEPLSSVWRDFWRTWILGALLPVYLLTTFVGTLARVDGESMEPTLASGEVVGPTLVANDRTEFSIPADARVVLSWSEA